MKALFAEGDEEANAAYEEVVELMSMAKLLVFPMHNWCSILHSLAA